MSDDDYREPNLPTRIGWFFWRNWSRLLCATLGHPEKPNGCCARCGLPLIPGERRA
jgi:hypothetical protein